MKLQGAAVHFQGRSLTPAQLHQTPCFWGPVPATILKYKPEFKFEILVAEKI